MCIFSAPISSLYRTLNRNETLREDNKVVTCFDNNM